MKYAAIKYQIDSHGDAIESTRQVLIGTTTFDDAVDDMILECKAWQMAGGDVGRVSVEQAYLHADSGKSYMVQVEEFEDC